MTITKEGALASFYTMNKAPIKHLRVYFSPKQAGSGTPSPENVREISGWDNINYYQSNKNLLSDTYRTYPNTSMIAYYQNNNLLLPPGTYTLSINDIMTTIMVNDPSAGTISQLTNTNHVTFTLDKSRSLYFLFVKSKISQSLKCQLEVNNTVSNFIPSNNQINSLNWSNDIGTVYGGYIDLITGELVQEWKKLSFIKSYILAVSEGEYAPYYAISATIGNASTQIHTIYSNKINNSTSQTEWNGCLTTERRLVFGLPNSLSTLEAVQNWMEENGGFDIVYKLATPITYQLTPLELQTLVGRNNVWSNADRIEVEYDLAESNEELYKRRHLLLQGAPHIESANGNIASFNTDLIAPLKSAKVNFLPTLLCDGIQSPTNIGTFLGTSSVTLFNTSNYISLDPINFEPITNTDVTAYYLGGNKFYFDGTAGGTRMFYFPITPFTLYKGVSRYINIITSTESASFSSKKIGLVLRNSTSGTTLATNVITLGNSSHQTNIITAEWPDDDVIVNELAIALFTGLKNVTVQFVFSYNPINNTSISLGNTLYGGYIDLITGDLIQTHASFTFNDTSYPTLRVVANNNNNYAPYIGATQSSFPQEEWLPSLDNNRLLCNIFKPVGTMLTDTHLIQPYETGFYIAANGLIRVVFGLPQEISDTTKLGNLFTETGGAQFVYKLATPIRYQKTSSQLKSLKGINNIWANTNGSIDIKYWTH